MTMRKLMLAGYCEHDEFSDECVICESARLNAEFDSLKAQLATEREAHEKSLAESEARYVAQTDALLKVEREAHARTLAALSAIWETAASGGSVADDTDWAAVHDAIAAAKVTP